MTYRITILLLLLCFKNVATFSQQFGGNPPSIKFRQINTPAVRVIFPAGLDSAAERVGNVITWLNNTTKGTIGTSVRKVNLVLQNQTTISNAYVSLAPFRSEFFLTPEINSFQIGSLPWIDQLAIHEYRHVQQYNNFNVGVSKLVRSLFGEAGQALANGAVIPNWFFEGDAVYNETNVSNQGRGRIPFFYAPYRSLWAAGKKYSWMKLRNGSYKDFIPDHYALGYLLVAYGREKYGDEFWKNVTHDAAAFKGVFYPFQKAIQKYAGKDYTTFRYEALDYFKTYFSDKVSATKAVEKKEFINEEFPVRINANEVLLMKSGYKRTPAFIIRSVAGDRKLRARDISLDNYFSYRNGKIVYASYKPDIRWSYRDFSDLRIIDITTGKEHAITKRSKYFTPDISSDGKKIVAVNVKMDGTSDLHLIDAENGHLLSSIPNAEKLFYTYPKFYNNNSIVSAVRDINGRMSIALITISSGNISYLIPFSYNVIGFPSVSNDTIYYTGAFEKDEHLFACIAGSNHIYKLTVPSDTASIGAYNPNIYNNSIDYSVFTASGFRHREHSLQSLTWQEIQQSAKDLNPSDFGISSLSKTNSDEIARVGNETYPVSTYRKSTGFLNFHSIQPYANDPEYTLTFLGENILNTLASNLSVSYNRAEQWKKVGFTATYGALFPYISAAVNYTIDRKGRYHGKTIQFNELEPSAGLSVLLDLSKNRSLRRLNFGSSYTYNQTDFQGAYKDTLGSFSYSYLNNFVSFRNQVQRARQQIFPLLAQTVELNYKNGISTLKGSQFVANVTLYIPGFVKNHSLALNGAFLTKDTAHQLNLSANFPFSRGYISQNLYQMYKWGATYHFPLFYPDAGIASVVYFSRIRANLFYDETYVHDFFSSGTKFKANFKSLGSEVYFDTKWWNQAVLTFGLRYSYLLDPDLFGNRLTKNRWEIILPINIFQQ